MSNDASDTGFQSVLAPLMNQFVQEKNVSVILTTHDSMVQSYASYNFHIQDGMLMQELSDFQKAI